jgi:hypothetical protein
MYGVATFKSHVLRREEKGMLGIPFKRWLGSGLGGALALTIVKIPWPDQSLLIGLVTAILLLYLTSPKGGIPRWRTLLLSWRWTLRSAAAMAPQSVVGYLGQLLQLSVDMLQINADAIFRPTHDGTTRTQLTDWVSFQRPIDAEVGEGMVFRKRPALGLKSGA